jgi:hypothetical protein
MRSPKITPLLFIAIVAMTVTLCLILPLPEDASAFAGTTNVVFTARVKPLVPVGGKTDVFTSSPPDAPWEDSRLTVSDPAAVQRLVAAVRLRRKDPRQCGPHTYQADFQTTNGHVRVSFCNHGFDVMDPRASNERPWEGARHFQMPKDFYEQFRSYVEQQTNIQWLVLRL